MLSFRLKFLLPTALLIALSGCAHHSAHTSTQAEPAAQAMGQAVPAAPSPEALERARQAETLREKGLEILYAKDPKIKNTAQAFSLLQQAADLGDPVGMDSIGGFYSVGLPGVVERDCRKAVDWFERAAATGYGLAANNLAYIYLTCPEKNLRDPDKAAEIMHSLFLTNPTLPAVLDTYAAVLASQGEFPKASATMTLVVELMELLEANPQQIDEAKHTLDLYKKRKTLDADSAKSSTKKSAQESGRKKP
jgi:TPR repeat protein